MGILKIFILVLIFPFHFSFAQEKIFISPSPIFNDVNFYPGKKVLTQVSIQNATSKSYQKIILKGERVLDQDNFSQAFELKVQNLDSINLSEFLDGKSLVLKEKILPKETKNLNFILSFKESGEEDNIYQGKKLVFNFIFEFVGEKTRKEKVSGIQETPQILKESIFESAIGEDFVEISWQTNFPGTSQIIYAKEGERHILDLSDNQGNPPKYGYQRTTPEYDLDPQVTFHKVKISGLDPGTTYFYRCVSRGSLAISEEYSFKTKPKKKEARIPREIKEVKKPSEKEIEEVKAPSGEISLPPSKKGGVKPEVLGKFYPSLLSSIKNISLPFCLNLNGIFWFILSFIFGLFFGYFFLEKLSCKKGLFNFLSFCHFWWIFVGFFLGTILGYFLRRKIK